MPEWLMSHLGEAAALTAALLWSVAVIFYHRAGRSMAPLGLNFAKGVVSLVLLVTALALSGQLFSEAPSRVWVLLAISGAIGIGVGDTAFFGALNRLGPRRTLLAALLSPPMTAVISWAALGEGLGLITWAGIVVTVLGIAWVIAERIPNDVPARMIWAGLGFAFVSSLSQSVGLVISRDILKGTEITPLWSAFPRLAAGMVFICVAMAVVRAPLMRRTGAPGQGGGRLWGAVALAALLGTFLGVWLQQVSVKFTDAGVAQTLLAMSPVFALLMAVTIQRERVSWRAAAGAIIALGGVAMLSFR